VLDLAGNAGSLSGSSTSALPCLRRPGGVIAEDELDAGQGFRNAWEETKFQAEGVARAVPSLPVTVLRPSTVVGDSRTGEIDRFEGPYSLGILLVASPLVVPLPLPGDGVAPLNVVPVDFVVRAAAHLARDARSAGRTFHLVDPNPMSARRVYELIAERANRRIPASPSPPGPRTRCSVSPS
jgi:nucleoside-diphosphate-sugar epimerase